MHSNGRGEEAPEPYQGVALPAGQQPPATYGDHIHPTGGTPWGDPAQQGGTPPIPPQAPPPYPPQAVEPADATQMLPPYPPQGVEPADATQMLPPYPGAGPAPIPAAPPQPAVPVADATQMLPPYPGTVPPAPAPAEATQALPLPNFHEQQQPYDASYGQQPPQGYPGPEFPGQQQYAEPQQYPGQQLYADQQQYADPQSYGGQQQYAAPDGYDQPEQQPGPQHDSDYDHLFRNDVPGPEPLRQRIIQPPSAQQQAQQHAPQQGYGRPPWEPGYTEDGYDDGDAGRRRMSPKVLIGIVVAGCVVAGLVVGALMNSGGKSSTDAKPTQTATGKPAGSASDSPKANAGGDAESQAKALDALLKTSGASRSSVVGAVESIKSCKNLPGAASDLRAAATQRTGLVTQLGNLAVDKLPKHAELTAALTKAWQASSSADGHYAAWADQAANGNGCKGGHARTTSETQSASKESNTATAQKKAAVKLWNSIATTYGLTQRQYSQL